MKRILVAAVLALAGASVANAGPREDLRQQLLGEVLSGELYQPQQRQAQTNNGLFGLGSGNVKLNAYGPGVGMDQFGAPVQHDPLLELTPNAYGPGVGMDQFGRPVK